MPDTLAQFSEAPAPRKCSRKKAAEQPAADISKAYSKVWGHMGDVHESAESADVAFSLVWMVMERLSGIAFPERNPGIVNQAPEYVEQLYLLMNAIDDRLKEIKQLASKAQDAVSPLRPVPGTVDAESGLTWLARRDPMEDLRVELNRALAAMQDTPEIADQPNGGPAFAAAEAAYHEASERLVEARSTTLLGILLKLERIDEVEDLDGHLRNSPKALWVRTIKGLIRDLRSALGRTE